MYFITTKRMLEVCFFQHTPTFIIEPEKQICIGVKDVDGVKTTNRHPKFMIRFLLSYCCRLEILTILLP